MPQRILPLNEGFKRLGVARSTGYRLRDTDPDFPQFVEITTNRRGLLESELDRYIEILAARRAGKAA